MNARRQHKSRTNKQQQQSAVVSVPAVFHYLGVNQTPGPHLKVSTVNSGSSTQVLSTALLLLAAPTEAAQQ